MLNHVALTLAMGACVSIAYKLRCRYPLHTTMACESLDKKNSSVIPDLYVDHVTTCNLFSISAIRMLFSQVALVGRCNDMQRISGMQGS